MELSWANVACTALWGGLLALERRAFLQAMFSRPIVAALGTGALLGDLQSGAAIGLVFELRFLGTAALGADLPDYDTLPSVVGTVLAAALDGATAHRQSEAVWALAVLLALPLGPIGRRVEATLDSRARRYLGRAQSSLEHGHVELAARQNLRAMWPQFAAFATLSAASVVVGAALPVPWRALPESAHRSLDLAWPLLILTAAGIAVRGSHARRPLLVAGVAGLLALSVILALGLGRSGLVGLGP